MLWAGSRQVISHVFSSQLHERGYIIYEFQVFIENLCKNKLFKIAKTFNSTHRLLDDINPKNNFGNLNLYKYSIYSPGLIINKENTDNYRTSMLEIDMYADYETKRFTTFLFDKRDKFGSTLLLKIHQLIVISTIGLYIMYSQRK